MGKRKFFCYDTDPKNNLDLVKELSEIKMEDLPFGETTTAKEVPVILVNWDGNTYGRAHHLVGMEDGYCHVSDIVINDYRELLGKSVHYIYKGEKKSVVLDESKVKEDIYKGQTGFEFWDNESDYFTVAVFSLPEEVVPGEGADPLPRGLYFSFDKNYTGSFVYGRGYVVGIDGDETTTEITKTIRTMSGKYVEGMGWAEKSVSGKVVVEETAYRVNTSDFGALVNPEPRENGSYASMPTEFSFESGKTYRITVDGVPYIGTAEYREGYGNFGGGDGVPLVDENGGYHGVFVTAMGAGYSNYFYYDEGPEVGHTGSFIIEEVAEVETIHPIDEKFLPAGGSGPFVVKAAALDGGFCTCDKSLTEINAAIASGVPVMGVFGDIPVFYAGGNTFVQFSDGIITTWSYEDEYRWYPNA